jgi:hypothetical protein
MVALEPESAACAPIGLALVLFRPALLFVGALAHVSARIALQLCLPSRRMAGKRRGARTDETWSRRIGGPRPNDPPVGG